MAVTISPESLAIHSHRFAHTAQHTHKDLLEQGQVRASCCCHNLQSPAAFTTSQLLTERRASRSSFQNCFFAGSSWLPFTRAGRDPVSTHPPLSRLLLGRKQSTVCHLHLASHLSHLEYALSQKHAVFT